jgi:hypothetical protein
MTDKMMNSNFLKGLIISFSAILIFMSLSQEAKAPHNFKISAITRPTNIFEKAVVHDRTFSNTTFGYLTDIKNCTCSTICFGNQYREDIKKSYGIFTISKGSSISSFFKKLKRFLSGISKPF